MPRSLGVPLTLYKDLGLKPGWIRLAIAPPPPRGPNNNFWRVGEQKKTSKQAEQYTTRMQATPSVWQIAFGDRVKVPISFVESSNPKRDNGFL